MDVEQLFQDLESYNSYQYEETKKKLAELFNQTKEHWLVQGMMDYYLRTGSSRSLDVLVKVQAPHDVYIFERLSDWIRGHHKLPAINFFGFIIRKHPTWLYKVAKHKFFKDILKLLQTEKEIIPLLSALLCIITLLPIIPSLAPNFLSDLFDVFGHLAIWSRQYLNKMTENHLIHLQIGLYMLFHRLYGMYPCNFLSYLRDFNNKEKNDVFQNTIGPLLETVRMHPMLVTANRESEISNTRWKEMDPHDVVVECVKLSLHHQQDNPDNFFNMTLRSHDSVSTDITASLNSNISHLNTPLQTRSVITSPFQSSLFREKLVELQKIDSIWSPSVEILSTPPPTNTVPNTPTPCYGVPTALSGNTLVLSSSGTSPPEAAVEATPETTPLKDINFKRPMGSNSPAVRSLLIGSQPSSPMRKEQSPFNFSDAEPIIATNGTTQRIMQIVTDRNQSQKLTNSRGIFADGCSPSLPYSNYYDFQHSQEDEEVTEITSQNITTHNSDLFQGISNEYDEGKEKFQCSTDRIHKPNSNVIRLLRGNTKRNLWSNYCTNDYNSNSQNSSSVRTKIRKRIYGQKLCRSSSWPNFKVNNFKNAKQYNIDKSTQELNQLLECDSMSEANNMKSFQQNLVCRTCADTSGDLAKKTVETVTATTQTIKQWPQIYENDFVELLIEENKIRNNTDCKKIQSFELLEKCIEQSVKVKQLSDGRNREDFLQEQIKLLHLHLQYEQYRREIHAERNRRILGRSRTVRSLEIDNNRLKDQLVKTQEEIHILTNQMNKSRSMYNIKEQELLKELNKWKIKYNSDQEEKKILKSKIEHLQKRVTDEIKIHKNINIENDVLRGDIFDLQNDLQQAKTQADLGIKYKEELIKLKNEFLLMGEIQIKCRDKLMELDSLKKRDEEFSQLQEAYNEDIKELRSTCELKTSQLETARLRISELQSQLSSKDIIITDQKRLLKSAKEEYQEKLDAVEKKYDVQKALITQMEDRMIELFKTPAFSSSGAFSPESEKADIASSIEHISPLSLSLASSEGLSASLRSVTEFRNLQALVVKSNTSNDQAIISTTAPTSTSSSMLQQPSTSFLRRGSIDQYNIQSTTMSSLTKSSGNEIERNITNNKQISSSASSSPSRPERHSAPSLDIPVPSGSNKNHPNLRNNYSSKRR